MLKDLTARCRRTGSGPGNTDFTIIDSAAYLLILLFGGWQFLSYMRAADVIYDATYVDLARSLLDRGSYDFDFRPETLLPPGLPALLALAWRFFGRSQAVGLHLMAVCGTLALAASYELLRRIEGRSVALIACLLLASSPALFMFTTGLAASDLPYFLASALALLLAVQLDRAGAGRVRTGLILACGISVVAAILFRTAGTVIVIALVGWIAASFWLGRDAGPRRLKLFWLPVVLGLCTQLIWAAWSSRRESPEWPVPGYPQPYFAQLKVKNGNEPLLGMATLGDIPARVGQNLDSYSFELVKLLTRSTRINPYWCSPFVAGVVLLLLLGLLSSLASGGGQLHDWYFALYGITVLLWPWDFEMRFLLPVIPLACLYLWRGGKTVLSALYRKSLADGACFFLVGATLALFSLQWVIRTHLAQAFLALGVWMVALTVGAVMIAFRSGKPSLRGAAAADRLASIGRRYQERLRVALVAAAFLACSAFVAKGVVIETGIAHWNATFSLTNWILNPPIEAAQWIRQHEPSDVVVMARKNDIVYHYSDHRVVWFPPTNDAKLLMQGIQKYNVSIVVVVDQDDGYWRPSQQVCFEPLRQAYPEAFRPVFHGRGYWIYEVDSLRPTPLSKTRETPVAFSPR